MSHDSGNKPAIGLDSLFYLYFIFFIIMDSENIDVFELRHSYIVADANLLAQNRLISILQDENKHLRQVIEMLITSKSPTL